eukprot:TRINITY_DN2223_c4_g1_i1.p1 TRINITY_DN2223_c4_g1~~TRINITY_DN2223_c4_g1_i1.p1  ORF type:complete len:556 (+),score=73.84 TRINITY_DN2223_c4_g1_i1:37-1704(+)
MDLPGMCRMSVLVWVADKHLEDIIGGQLYREDVDILNATHLAAILENRLNDRGIPIAVGMIDWFDEGAEKWIPMSDSHDFNTTPSSPEQPLKLRVWSRRRQFTCRLHPLREPVSPNYPLRTVSFYAMDIREFDAELRSKVPPYDSNFKEILYLCPFAGWALLEDISKIPVDAHVIDLKLLPSDFNKYEILPAPDLVMPPGNDSGSDERLRYLIAMEQERQRGVSPQEEELVVPVTTRKSVVVPEVAVPFGQDEVMMPGRIAIQPLPHTSAEVRYLHNSNIATALQHPSHQEYLERVRKKEEALKQQDPNRIDCCYPGSGQVHSVDSSGHGDLKRQVISYTRQLLQDPCSPVQDHLPIGGLPTQDLVNLTALVGHYFMVRCPCRPHATLEPEDKAHIHNILANCISELPYTATLQRKREEDLRRAQEAAPSVTEQIENFRSAANSPPPQVVLMRPVLSEDSTDVVYGTVTYPSPVVCKWFLNTPQKTLDIEDIFIRGLAVTEPVSASSFCLKFLPGALQRGLTYNLTLRVTPEASHLQSHYGESTQQFSLPVALPS